MRYFELLFITFTYGFLPLFFLSACSNTTVSPAQTYTVAGLTTHTVAEDTETNLIKTPNDLTRFCAARESDAISAPQEGISFGFGTGISKESIGTTSSNAALSLGGRDPLVLITREFMYRVCELSLNHNLSKEETITLYKLFLDKLIAIAPLTKSDGAASQGVSPSPQINQQNSVYDTSDSDNSYSKDKYNSFDNFNTK
ncbi:MAG: hypothetical protein PHR87_03350 [Sulfurospirillaceae bacterium]|nr:hypothetical protein [Sulfurospirillaceae bacterium]